MPKICIIHYKDIDYSGYDCYADGIIPLSTIDWTECTDEELHDLRQYYKSPRPGLKHMILEQVEQEKIPESIAECVALAEARRKEIEDEKAKKDLAKKIRARKKQEKEQAAKEEQLNKLAKELGVTIAKS